MMLALGAIAVGGILLIFGLLHDKSNSPQKIAKVRVTQAVAGLRNVHSRQPTSSRRK